MIQVTFKAKHYYFIAYHLKNASIQYYYTLINKIKTALVGNTDLEADTLVETTVNEIINIYKILTQLPEGMSNIFNTEMSDLLEAQIIAGVTTEIVNGGGPDADGNLPETSYWQKLANALTDIRNESAAKRDAIVTEGKSLIETL